LRSPNGVMTPSFRSAVRPVAQLPSARRPATWTGFDQHRRRLRRFQEIDPPPTNMSRFKGANALQFGANSLGGAIISSATAAIRFRRGIGRYGASARGCRPPAAPTVHGTDRHRLDAAADGFRNWRRACHASAAMSAISSRRTSDPVY
jgi:hypothetical protein